MKLNKQILKDMRNLCPKDKSHTVTLEYQDKSITLTDETRKRINRILRDKKLPKLPLFENMD